jgi:hypothetical protein
VGSSCAAVASVVINTACCCFHCSLLCCTVLDSVQRSAHQQHVKNMHGWIMPDLLTLTKAALVPESAEATGTVWQGGARQ